MKKVVIIGAGPAGITAGYELLKQTKEYEVTILEESNQIGGLSRTVCYKGNRMDIGGHRFFSKDDRVLQWWQEFLPLQDAVDIDEKLLRHQGFWGLGGPDPNKEDQVMLLRKRISHIYYQKKFIDYPVTLSWNTFQSMGLGCTLEAGCSYLSAALHKREEFSLEDFYINRFGKKLYEMFFKDYTRKVWGRHPKDISPDWGVQRVKGLSIAAVLKDIMSRGGKREDEETSLIKMFRYPKYGPGQLWEAAAREFQNLGGKILMNQRVTGIRTQDGQILSVRVENALEKEGPGIEIPADILISSMPLKDLVQSMDQVPAKMRKIAEGLPYRNFVTVGLLTDRLNLKNKKSKKNVSNMIPDCWIYVQDPGIQMGRIQIFNNWSPYLVADPVKTVWLGLEYFCGEEDACWCQSEEEWVSLAVREMIAMGIIASPQNVLDAHCEKVKKAYPAYFDTYSQINALRIWLDRYSNLYCIGRNGQHRYNNIDHSMETAFAAVESILGQHSSREKMWNINADMVYQESK